MKRLFSVGALAGALLFCGCDVDATSSLRDVSRPYVAEYACKTLVLGGADLLGDYEFIKLDLAYSGDFRLFYADKEGGEGEFGGTYVVSEEAGTIALTASAGGKEQTFVFPYEKGTITIEYLFLGRMLYAEFSAVE